MALDALGMAQRNRRDYPRVRKLPGDRRKCSEGPTGRRLERADALAWPA